MRPANIVTAIADVLAGIAICGGFTEFIYRDILLLMLSTAGLYGGGVVFNDVYDSELDKIERPERPIPSGLISRHEALMLGILLLTGGVFSAALVSIMSAVIALLISFLALLYDKWGKHQNIFGPVNMGLCRGLNLLLGVSIFPMMLQHYWFLGLVPVIYIAAITMISRGEVHGGNKNALHAGAFLYAAVIILISATGFINGNLLTLLFIAAFALMIYPPLIKAIKDPKAKLIGRSVRAGVLALILMNASWAAAFGLPGVALTILFLLPVSLILARLFAVT
jgi:hypothetical protein